MPETDKSNVLKGHIMSFNKNTWWGEVYVNSQVIQFHGTSFHGMKSGSYPAKGDPVHVILNNQGKLLAVENRSLEEGEFLPVLMTKDWQIDALNVVLKFCAPKERKAIEEMIDNRGGKLEARHCSCGKIADICSRSLYECQACYERGYGR